MPNERKHVRIAIPADLVEAFDRSKKEAEDALHVKMTDSQFAASLIRWAIGKEKDDDQ